MDFGKEVIVGIDFGTCGIGYSYSFKNNVNNITLSDLPGQGADSKVPTEIILDHYLESVLAFGSECKSYILTKDKSEYEYFKDIKMNLYNNIYLIKSTNGREVNIETIIFKILESISKNAISQIQRANKAIEKEDIKWVLTVPAIWGEKSKQIMINASIRAGLIEENRDKSLFLALEPEVAGIYFYISSLSDSNFKCMEIAEGKPYIICDIGAGTVDICTHKKIIEGKETKGLYEEYPPLGGDFGGHKINEEFIKRLIIPLFGEENVKKLKDNSNDNEDWVNLETDIEKLKRAYSDNQTEFLSLNFELFNNEDNPKNLEYYISEYNQKNLEFKYEIKKKKKWVLEFSSQIFTDIIKELSQKIFSKLEEIYHSVNTGYIILTGAGSKNNVLIQNFYDLANEKNIKLDIITPPHPEISIMKGAVLFGFQNDIIRKRKAKYTLGIKSAYEWKQKYEGKGEKKYEENDKKYYCVNLFYKFITINEYIDFNKVIVQRFNAANPNPELIFYKTYRKNCEYIDEKDEKGNFIVEELGKVKFNIGEEFDANRRGVTIKIKLGGTYIDACAIYEKNGKKLNITQYF